MKTFLKLSAVLLLAAFTFQADAQLGTNTSVVMGSQGGVLPIIPGGTNNITGATTNLYTNSLVLPVSQHANVGLSVSFVAYPSTATNGNLVLLLKRSFDNGTTYETTAYQTVTDALPTALQQSSGTTNWTYLTDLGALTNATHVQITSIANTGGSTAWLTNLLIEFNVNNQTVWTTGSPR